MISIKNKAGQVRGEGLNNGPAPALHKLANFGSLHSLLKTEEELSREFESFFVEDYDVLNIAKKEQSLTDFEAIDEVLPVVYERGGLIAENSQHEAKEIPQADSGNRLFASLKRHPE